MSKPSILRFKSFIESHQLLSDEAWELLSGILEVHSVRKHDIIVAEGQICRFVDYIDSGSLRSFYNNDGEEVSTGLHLEGHCVTNMASLSKDEPSKLTIQANEDSVLVRFYKNRLISLYDTSPELQSIGRAVLEAMVVEENSYKEMYALYSAEERYRYLTTRFPALALRFPLQHIASFLGIRRETLSRIRTKASSRR